jgi:predicted MFS family arabinose efflux permease
LATTTTGDLAMPVRARFAVLAVFWLCGFICALWSASLPTLNARLGLGETRLGIVLLLTAVGSMAFMPVIGRLCDRWSSRSVLRAAAPVAALALLAPALAPDYPTLLVAAFVLGGALGSLDVAMNAQAVEVEVWYGRPIMSSFHGVWSLGAVLGGVTITTGLHLQADGTALMVGGGLTTVALLLLPGKHLLPPMQRPEEPQASKAGLPTTVVVLLGLVAMAGFVSEGAGYNWAALHAGSMLGADPATASLAYTIFAGALTVTRLTADRLRMRFSAAAAMRGAGTVAVAGYTLVIGAPLLPAGQLVCGYVGWAIVAAGLATVVPGIFSAIGASDAGVGRALSWVTTLAYAGQLGGPAVIGPLADATSLGTAMLVPGALAVVIALAGPIAVRQTTTRTTATV